MKKTRFWWIVAGIFGCIETACSTPPEQTSFAFGSAEYASCFEATRDALRAASFDLDVVDARRGLVTTYPCSSAGWFTPWNTHAADSDQATADALRRTRRIARVTFAPADGSTAVDLREWGGEIAATVEVQIEEIQRARQAALDDVDPADQFANEPRPRREQRAVIVERGADEALAARLSAQIRAQVNGDSGD